MDFLKKNTLWFLLLSIYSWRLYVAVGWSPYSFAQSNCQPGLKSRFMWNILGYLRLFARI